MYYLPLSRWWMELRQAFSIPVLLRRRRTFASLRTDVCSVANGRLIHREWTFDSSRTDVCSVADGCLQIVNCQSHRHRQAPARGL